MILVDVSDRRALPRRGSVISPRRNRSMPFAAACPEEGYPAGPHPREYCPQCYRLYLSEGLARSLLLCALFYHAQAMTLSRPSHHCDVETSNYAVHHRRQIEARNSGGVLIRLEGIA